MTNAFVRLPLALSAASLLAFAPASARDPQLTVIAPKVHTVRVPYQDLDLRDSAGVAVLQARVNEASLEVCSPAAFDQLLDGVERSNCIVNARIEARPQIAKAIEQASNGQTIALAAIQVSTAL